MKNLVILHEKEQGAAWDEESFWLFYLIDFHLKLKCVNKVEKLFFL